MFGNRYFAGRYFADRYFPPGGDAAAEAEETNTGGYVYNTPYQKHIEEFKRRDEEEARKLAAAERRLEEHRAEQARRKEELRFNRNLAREQQALEAAIREEINRILFERAALVRLIDDEEVALVLLLSLPFKS